VSLYGDRNNWFAAYAYWYLKYYGHDNVKPLNGAREHWISEGRPTTSELPAHRSTTFTAKPSNSSIRTTRDEVLAAIGGAKQLVDVRSPQEFSGELVAMPGYENESALRSGHIPGAKSIPWPEAVRVSRPVEKCPTCAG
jgi:thiosulfate/3-mercaptopyruvate sulfurtransferase